jgi:exopolyphosphatase/pppGpp-phosphohydrolase
MPKRKAKRESGKAALASVKTELAKPRMAKSARGVRAGQILELLDQNELNREGIRELADRKR